MEEDQEEEEAPVVVGWEAARQGLGSWLGGGGGEVFESCPGCEEEVRLEELEVGVCKEEHVFGESLLSSRLSLCSRTLLFYRLVRKLYAMLNFRCFFSSFSFSQTVAPSPSPSSPHLKVGNA